MAAVLSLALPLAPAAGAVEGRGVAPGAPATFTAASPSAAVALPHDHLALGVSADPNDLTASGWLPTSGVRWDYAYQYLAGGANTGGGWQTWNAGAQFPVLYARAAQAAAYTPVFPYYMLLQSNGPCGSCGEQQKDLAHLDDPAVMAAWFLDFATLMQRLGSDYGGPAVVHVEPDLSGYAEQAVIDPANHCFGHCTGGGNDPNNLHAAVASSGVAAVAGFADTYQGFNDAVLHLRDLYAPNVALAFHVSDWATLFDVGSYPGGDEDFAAKGQEAGQFAAASGVVTSAPGVSHYDVVFNDVADRDSGISGVWWDRTNRTLPDFARWESYVAAIHAVVGVGVFVWQIPVGNQWFDTVDGTPGHEPDNRVEYFLAHPDELVRAGIVGLLFGGGNAGTTSPMDAEHDGVTNPPPHCTGDGMGGGTICNDHVSTSPDDDGGYLQQAAAAYYQHPTALTAGPVRPYRLVASDGGIFTFGGATFLGSTGAIRLIQPIGGMAATPDGNGYWLVASDGGIFSFGDAAFRGSTGAIRLNQPIVGMEPTPDGNGYWLVARDGGVFSFGDASFHGSTGAVHLVAPIVGMAATPDGRGYWMVASDGGVFAFGDAAMAGSLGGRPASQPVVGMAATPSGKGYWLVDAAGGVYTFGDAAYHGSTGGGLVTAPIIGLAPTADGGGYWEAGADGTVLGFGDATVSGSLADVPLARPIVGLS